MKAIGKDILFVDCIRERTKALGPGIRAVIWFHGCTRGCPGCVAERMNRSSDFSVYSVDELAAKIVDIFRI